MKSVKELALVIPLGELGALLLPSSVFALVLNSLKLTGFTVVEPPWFVGFGNLTFLELLELILPVIFFETFLPKCPLLEELRVVECNAVSLVFVSPSLEVLFLECKLKSICFKYIPLLSVLNVLGIGDQRYVIDNSETHGSDMVAVFAALPALQRLELGIEFLLFLCTDMSPRSCLHLSSNLKVLQSPRILFGKLPEMRVLVCLIMSSPNLWKLAIVHDDDDESHPEFEVIDSLQMF